MNKREKDAISTIIDRLGSLDPVIPAALLGFDACIDNIVRVVKDKNQNPNTSFFKSSDQLGEFLIGLDNRSCGIELQTSFSKTGGNMVITANALGNLGVKIDCIGTFGVPDILPVFRSVSSNCNLLTVGETISATALEFNDSKVIMFDPGPYNNLTWEGIKDIMGIERIKTLFSGKQLVSFLNWSEIENSSSIWEGILNEIFPSIEQVDRPPFFFTDFSDCSRRSKEEILYVIDLLRRFRNYFKVTLSLNQNEADLIATALGISPLLPIEEFIKSLFNSVSVNILVIHRVKDAITYDGVTFEMCETFFCKQPSILTGGGDNFNAGFCYSQLYGFDLFQSLVVANAVSGSYVATGISPDLDTLTQFLKQYLRKGSGEIDHNLGT